MTDDGVMVATPAGWGMRGGDRIDCRPSSSSSESAPKARVEPPADLF